MPRYEITPIGCSCPADRYRSDACKHRGVVSFLGDGSSGSPDMDPELNTNQKDNSDRVLEHSLDDLFG